MEGERFDFGPFRLDPAKLVLWRGGEVVSLTPKALALLRALVEAGGDVVPKSDLMSRVWPDTVVEEANLSVTVASLRKALGTQDDGRSWIETVPRRGYRFLGPVRGPERGRELSLAVLPFQGLGPGAEPHLGLGMADALIGRLTGLEGLRVRPTGAVAHLAGVTPSPHQAAADLGVDAVLTGTLQRDRERVRLSVQLVPRGAAPRPWAAQFDARFTDIFGVQDDVAEQVAAALETRLGRPRPAAGAAHTPRLDAWETCLRGRYFWSRLDPEAMGKAVSCFIDAAAQDPDWAAPQAGLADAHILMAFAGLLAPGEAWDLAGEAARRALDRDPGLAEAHVSSAWVALFRDWDWPAARGGLERALALRPGAPALRQWLGLLLGVAGDVEGARREIAHAREADPLSSLAGALQAFVLEIAGEHEEELLVARRAVELRPDRFLGYWSLGLAAVHCGRADEAAAALLRAVELTGEAAPMRAVLAWALARGSRADQARGLIEELLEEGAPVSPYQVAAARLALGEKGAALDGLERAAAARDPFVVFLKTDAAFAELRGDERFEALLARVYASA